jgi:predicted N-acetyltransferase YhbS
MRIEHLSSHQHLAAVAALLNCEWGELSPWASVLEIEKRLARQLDAPGVPFTMVALDDMDVLLGTASVKLFELPEHRDKMHWLGEVCVKTGLRGQGIGAALIRACIAESRRLRLPTLYLYTPDQQALYARLGWEELQRDFVNGENVSIMCLTLHHEVAYGRQ